MRLLISAAETSSDLHGSHLLKALQRIAPGPVTAFGMGGPQLKKAGLDCRVDASELLAMGFGEIFSRLPRILRARRVLLDLAEKQKPDLAIVIDYPDFHMNLAKNLKALGIPVVYFIPPKVWAWRGYRARTLRKNFARVLSILPFEVPFFERIHLPVTYVGSPLLDELPLDLTREEARARLGIASDRQVILLMPGSRPAEIARHFHLMLSALANVSSRLAARPMVLIPLPETQKNLDFLSALPSHTDFEFRVIKPGEYGPAYSALAMRAADFGIVKSGTSALEAALMGCPHFIIYRASVISEFIFKYLIRYLGPVGLPNLVYHGLGVPSAPLLVRELLADQASLAAVSAELGKLAGDADYRARLERGFAVIREKMTGDLRSLGVSPSERAAQAVLETARSRE